jgi:UDPglucose 6-dehydrogenase
LSRLVNQAARIQAFDPVAIEAFQKYTHLPSVVYAESAEAALEGADVLLILTEWPEFASVDTSIFATKLLKKTIFDGRNIFSLESMATSGVTYHSIGRPTVG